MTKYIITIAYDGSKYMGLQKLKNENTIQGELEEVLTKLDHNPVKVVSSGRTDRGVHANNQVCSFEMKKDIDPFRLRYYIDRSTSKYIFIKTCEKTNDPIFHARFSVKKKTYRYLIETGPYNPINADYVYNYNKALDIEKMKEGAKKLTGLHNYRAFVIGNHKTCDSIIDKIDVTKKGSLITITIKGKAFYTYMVRNIVESLVLVGSDRLTSNDIETMLNTGKKIKEYKPAPPGGLYLDKIEY